VDVRVAHKSALGMAGAHESEHSGADNSEPDGCGDTQSNHGVFPLECKLSTIDHQSVEPYPEA